MTAPSMTCGFCRREFREDRGQPTCVSCPLARGCRWVRCPYCGFENPAQPDWIVRWIRRRAAADGAR